MSVCARSLAFSLILMIILNGSIHLAFQTKEKKYFTLIGDVNASFEGGDGTQSNPYLISNITQLQDIRMNLSANYTIINDIDASETLNWNDGKGFEPIGNKENPFNGSLDGRGFNISSLYIDRKDLTRIGLIGCSKEAILSNISMVDVEIYGLQFQYFTKFLPDMMDFRIQAQSSPPVI